MLLNQHETQLKKLNNIKQPCLDKMFVRGIPMRNNPLTIYQTKDGRVKIEAHFENEIVWLRPDIWFCHGRIINSLHEIRK